jgi:hypothetical protein
MTEERRRQEWSKITAQAWEDPAFKTQLITHPNDVLKAHGMGFPDDYNVKIVEAGSPEASGVGQYSLTQNDDRSYSVTMRLPQKPAEVAEGELSDAELESVAGGVGDICCCCSCCPCCCCT